MKIKDNEKGAIFIEACVVIPLLMVVMLLFVFLINLFVVQSFVQYGLNQTVNELGNYTYYLNYLGIIDLSNKANDNLNAATEQNKKDYKTFEDTYNSVVKAINDGQTTVNDIQAAANDPLNIDIDGFITGVNTAADSIDTAAGNVKESWGLIKGYASNPTELLSRLKSQAFLELKSGTHSVLGALLGKMMLNRYVSEDFLSGCGVVSTSYNGTMKSGSYMTGIDGMDFSRSSFLGGDGSRQIDLVVYYRIKFPFNLTGWFGVTEGPLYDNSLLVVQRAAGYGWINGDSSGKGKDAYNKSGE
ncbi:MAG: hypothetical protein NC078_11330 [Ruminococcus sp.]|nr:hypothetical protein [Ruminococcus sp.]